MIDFGGLVSDKLVLLIESEKVVSGRSVAVGDI